MKEFQTLTTDWTYTHLVPWCEDGSRMQSPYYKPYLRRICGLDGAVPFCGGPTDPINHFEAGHAISSSRILTHSILRNVSDSLAQTRDLRLGDCNYSKPVSPSLQHFHNIYVPELLDFVRHMGDSCVTLLRGAGLELDSALGAYIPQNSIELQECGVRLSERHSIRIHPPLVEFLADEIQLIAQSTSELARLYRSPMLHAETLEFDPIREVYALALALGRLSIDDLGRLHESTRSPVPILPFFRAFTVSDIIEYATIEANGRFKSMEIEGRISGPVAAHAPGHGQLVPIADSAYRTLLAMRNLQSLRLHGDKLVETLLNIGREAAKKGIGPLRSYEALHDIWPGIQLSDGSFVGVAARVANLLGYNRHENRAAEKRRLENCPDPAYAMSTRPDEIPWTTEEHVTDGWVPDILDAYAILISFGEHELSTSGSQSLVTKLLRASQVCTEGPYSKASLNKLVNAASRPRLGTETLSVQTEVDFARFRFSTAFLWNQEREPGQLEHSGKKPWPELSRDRKLFELLYAGEVLQLFGTLGSDELDSLAQTGRTLLNDPVNIQLKASNVDPIPLGSGLHIKLDPHLFSDTGLGNLAEWIHAEELCFEIAATIHDRSVRPPGKRGQHSVQQNFDSVPKRVLEKTVGQAYGHAFVLACLRQGEQLFLQERMLREGWPGLGTVKTLAESFEWKLVAQFSKEYYRTRAAIHEKVPFTKDGPLSLWSEPKPERNELLYRTLLGPALLDMVRLQGKEALRHLWEVGRQMREHGFIVSNIWPSGNWAHFGVSLLGANYPAQIDVQLAWRMALQYLMVADRTKQLAAVIADELKDKSLRPDGYAEAIANISRPVEHPRRDFHGMYNEFMEVYSLAYVLGGYSEEELSTFLTSSYSSGEYYEVWQHHARGDDEKVITSVREQLGLPSDPKKLISVL